VELLLGTYRYHIFLKQVKPGVPFMLALRAQLANRFAAAITPSQTGGGPALLYVFSRGGIPVAQGLSVLLVNCLATLVFYFVSIGVAAYVLRDTFSNDATSYLIQYGFIAFGVMTVISIVALMRPVFELLAGCYTMRERTLRFLEPDEWGVLIRPELAEVYREPPQPDGWLTEPPSSINDPIAFSAFVEFDAPMGMIQFIGATAAYETYP